MGRLLLPLLPLYRFMHRSILLSFSHSWLFDCSPVPTIICGCLPCRSVDSRQFHVAFARISVAEIRTACCTRSSDELIIQVVRLEYREASHSGVNMGRHVYVKESSDPSGWGWGLFDSVTVRRPAEVGCSVLPFTVVITRGCRKQRISPFFNNKKIIFDFGCI